MGFSLNLYMIKSIFNLNFLLLPYRFITIPCSLLIMIRINTLKGIGLLAVLFLLATPKISRAQQDNYISDQEFYDDLQPYGTWIGDPDYGDVWVPDTDDDFVPYATNGYWVLTNYGNTWVSNYPWGWATFHYGRWHYDNYYGWEWIPGHQWAPAWVTWRHGGGYYGWAPLLPGISVRIATGGAYYVPDHYWTCAPEAYINSPNIYNYYIPRSKSVTIIHNTTAINNTYVKNKHTYITGPGQQEISQVTHQPVQIYKINKVSGPGADNVQNNTINIYRPAVHKSPDARPERVVNGTAYKQRNPDQAIAHKSSGGAQANHNNASKLAMVAKSNKPDSKMVHVYPVNNRPSIVRPANTQSQPGVTKLPQQDNQPGPPANNKPGKHNNQPAAVNPAQPGNQPSPPVDKRQQHQQQAPVRQQQQVPQPRPVQQPQQRQPQFQQHQRPAQPIQPQQRQQQRPMPPPNQPKKE